MMYDIFQYRRIGPRSHVWSEKEVVDKAAWEFEEVCVCVYTIYNSVGLQALTAIITRACMTSLG